MSDVGTREVVWQHALHWAIASPPLLADALLPNELSLKNQLPQNRLPQNQLPKTRSFTAADFHQLWQRWSPEWPVLPPEAITHGRLGRQFEALWQYWLQDHPLWRMRAANLTVHEPVPEPVQDVVANSLVNSAKKRGPVRGELDLLVQAGADEAIEHWELAVKFYLGVGNVEQPQHWLGPNLLDTLANKLQRLQQQLVITDTAAGIATLAATGLSVSARRAIVKGRLYYPLTASDGQPRFADPAHLRGVWASGSEWQRWLRQQPNHKSRLHARLYPRRDWLSGQSHTAEWLPFAPEPVAELLSMELDNGWQILLMPEDWCARAEAAIAQQALARAINP